MRRRLPLTALAAALALLGVCPTVSKAEEAPTLKRQVEELSRKADRAERYFFLSLAAAALLAAGVSYAVARRSASAEVSRRREGYLEGLEEALQGALDAIRQEKERTARFSLHLMEGLKEFEQENYEAALRACQEALAEDARSAVAWTVKGVALLKGQGRTEEALQALGEALSLDPNLVLALTARGAALVALERHEEALADFAQALEVDPKSVVALTGKGAALVLLERHEEALEAFLGAVAQDPRNAPAWAGKGVVLVSLERSEEALEAFDEAIGLAPHYAPAWYNKACALAKLGRRGEMLETLRTAIGLDPSYEEKAREDKDLDTYRDDPDFRTMVFEEGPAQ